VRFFGIDPGGKRMGLAIGDDFTSIATPLKILPYAGAKKAAETLKSMMGHHDVQMIVIGFPTAEDGSPTPACARSEAIAKALDELGVATDFQSEFLTTNEARRRAAEAGLRRSDHVDHIAAQVLLEEYLQSRCVN
jgi:putative Holliday junction resolvase